MYKEQLALRIWIGLLGSIVVAGIYFWWAKIQFGNPTTTKYTTKELHKTVDTLAVISGDIFISPGSLDMFQSIIGRAKQILWLQTYEFTEKKIKQQFKDLLDKNIEVKLIMENQKFQQFQNTFKQIQNLFAWYRNFQIKSDSQMHTKYVHSKIAIIDSGFLIQTANLTHSSFFTNREYFFWSTDTGVLMSLRTIFQKDREGKPLLKTDIHPNIVVCNINCRSVIEYLIQSATGSITIQNQYIDDLHIQWLLKQKIKELWAKNIQIQLPTTDKNKDTQHLLWTASVHLFSKPYLHAKMLLIDNRILLLWSMNLSANSLDNNREIWILLNDPLLIKRFVHQFQQDTNN